MKKIYRFAVIPLLVLIFTFSLGGCADANFSDDALLRPPKTTGDEAAIQDIIGEQAGGNYTLKYPESGDNRSAIIMHESEDAKCAVALYSTENDSKLNVSVILYGEKGWICNGTFNNGASGVDRVIFDDIDRNGTDDIIIGWSSYDPNKKTLSVYSIENETVREMTVDETYSDIEISDITGDSVEDIILLSLSTSKNPSQVKLLQYSEQDKRLMKKFNVLRLDSDVTEFAKISVGKIDKNTTGIVIDGKKSGDLLSTQIIYFDKRKNVLVNPLVTLSTEGQQTNVTTRKDSVLSRDVDSDGIIEVPVVTQMPASTDQNASNICSLTSWKQFSAVDSTLVQELSEVINYNDGYSFSIPDKWKNGAVTALFDAETRQLTFYVWDSGTGSLGDRLLTLYRYTKYEWDDIDKRAVFTLDNLNDKSPNPVFAAQIFRTDADDSLNITEKEVQNSLRPI